MNESEQAQAIEEVKLWFSLGRGTMKSSGEVEARKRVSDLLEIVDSKAQKIAKLTALCETPNAIMQNAARKMVELESQLLEARKEAHLYRTNFCMAARAATDDWLLPWEIKP